MKFNASKSHEVRMWTSTIAYAAYLAASFAVLARGYNVHPVKDAKAAIQRRINQIKVR